MQNSHKPVLRTTLAPPKRRRRKIMTGELLLNRYRIVRRLASGGMGVVYLARAEGFVKPVVVKRVLPQFSENDEFIKMFIREAKILANLNAPGIANVIDFEESTKGYMMVLEYVHGFEVREWVKYLLKHDKRIPTEVAIEIIISVLTTLQHVHGLKRTETNLPKIVHRDISPSNIMIDVEGRIKLVDFGITSIPPNTTQITAEEIQSFKGKISYAAPELFAGKPATPASDIYACGVTLHEMLVGLNEFTTPDPASTIHRVMTTRLSPVGENCRDAPDGIDEVIAKATEPNPERRYSTAEAFAIDLRRILPIPEHEALTRLAGLVHKDYNNPDMADFLGVESLDERERAWRFPSMSPSPATEEETQVESSADLFYRLNVVHLYVPPLRDRTEDIIPLARHFLLLHSKEMGKILDDDSADERDAILAALRESKGNRRQAARIMGWYPQKFYSRLKRYNIG